VRVGDDVFAVVPAAVRYGDGIVVTATYDDPSVDVTA
jgi:hypothetical protein